MSSCKPYPRPRRRRVGGRGGREPRSSTSTTREDSACGDLGGVVMTGRDAWWRCRARPSATLSRAPSRQPDLAAQGIANSSGTRRFRSACEARARLVQSGQGAGDRSAARASANEVTPQRQLWHSRRRGTARCFPRTRSPGAPREPRIEDAGARRRLGPLRGIAGRRAGRALGVLRRAKRQPRERDARNNAKLLSRMGEGGTAYYCCVLVMVRRPEDPRRWWPKGSGAARSRASRARSNGFGYDPLFL